MSPSFVKPSGVTTPFGHNEYLRSTNPKPRFKSYTLAAGTVTSRTIDGSAQKILPPGTVLAKITSGPDAGKVGPFQASGTAEVQTLTKAGTVSGGTFTLTYKGETTEDIAHDATAADVQEALNALSTIQADGGVTVTGGPINDAAFSVTFNAASGADFPALVSDVTNLTGSGAGVTVAEGTKGAAGATDGRGVTANIVGILDTFLPWQLLEGDREVAVATFCEAVQAWCYEYNAAGELISLTNNTAAELVAKKALNVNFV
jgi:hypothetical protein